MKLQDIREKLAEFTNYMTHSPVAHEDEFLQRDSEHVQYVEQLRRRAENEDVAYLGHAAVKENVNK